MKTLVTEGNQNGQDPNAWNQNKSTTEETPASTQPKTQEKPQKNLLEEEESKKETFHSEEENEHHEEEVDDADLFEYNVHDKGEPQLKEEHVPPPLPGNQVQPVVNINVNELDPYNPQERPLDSDDDPDDGETPEATDILLAFFEKVQRHAHGTKWKATLKQGIMNAKGKEYILSQIVGDFDF